MGLLLAAGQDLLKANVMLPSIGEVVGVDKLLALSEIQPDQRNLMGRFIEPQAAGPEEAVGAAVNLKLVQMEVRPAEGDLDRSVEFAKALLASD